MFTGGTPSFGDVSEDREELAGEESSEATASRPSSPQLSASDARSNSDGDRAGAEGVELE